MSLLGRRRRNAPRLSPELDDAALGRVRRRLAAPSSHGLDLSVALVEDVIRGAGQDWDRRTHRIGILAEAAGRGLPRSWRRRRPRSPDALALHAWSELVHARQDRSSAPLPDAADSCRLASERSPSDPVPWVILLGILRLQGRPAAELRPVWREIKDRDPWNRAAHLCALAYLSPNEHGSDAQALEFVEEARATAPDRSPVTGLELAALVHRHHRSTTHGGLEAVTAHHLWSRPHTARALGHAATFWPRPGHLTHAAALADLNMLAYGLIMARRLEEAAVAFEAIGGPVTAWPWAWLGDPLERFTHWHDRLLG
ncbi:hypothetical protein ACFVJH_36425 [Streptomyces decoyicus]|uniref:hypothetical protein n=1 Tax=Streptomyces decoyicus TaxID=249567 RepID=UPI00363CC9EB